MNLHIITKIGLMHGSNSGLDYTIKLSKGIFVYEITILEI